MFTGLILFLATIIAIETTDQGKNFTFSHPHLMSEIKLGDSVAINGVCLTATDITDTTFSVQAVHTTLEKTTLDHFNEGEMVNVELALKASDRCGGHFVQGHVNGVGTIKNIVQRGNAHDLQITIPAHLQKYLIQEGSIAIDGISLTIADIHDDSITLAIIPHTWTHTTLHNKKSGELVNIEVDILTKYAEQSLTQKAPLPGTMMKLHTIEQAINDIAQGKMIIVVDDENRENEGDFLMAAQHVTPESINFMARYGRGLICAPITAATAQKLEITPMVVRNNAPLQTAFTVSVEAAEGVSTGISAHDRARTIALLAKEDSRPHTFVKPGHVFPLVAKDGGVLQRPGHTEAAVDFARLAGLHPTGVICEIMKDDGTMARLPDLWNFAQEHNLTLVSIKDLIAYRKKHEQLVQKISAIDLHSEYGTFKLHCFNSLIDHQEVVALVKGEISHDEAVLVRIHSECFTGETLKSQRCDCGEQLSLALSQIEKAGKGILIYLKQEGRGIGLSNKIKAYALQDQGFDTVEANHQLGFATDMRDYILGAQVLKHFGITKIKLLTNNPEKVDQLTTYGIEIAERQALEIPPQKYNCAYLATKKYKLGHILS